MINKVIKKARVGDFSEIQENLEYWLSQPPDVRVAAVEQLREQYHGSTKRLQRVARIIQRTQG